ncbi:MAG: hypothetical protein U1E27_03505 [Kiritimatiellia bacterium]|nr:hypothetical protein [Kiritimatiellia bacterium]
MNIESVFQLVSRQLAEAGVDGLLIGGFAVNFYGYTRNTLDVDFMIVAEDAETVRRVMTTAGLSNVVIEDHVAFFSDPDSSLRVDFLNVDSLTMNHLMANAIPARVAGCDLHVPALKDLLAMKIHSLATDSVRRAGKDLPDIAYLSVLHHLDIEEDLAPICARYGNPDVFKMIQTQIAALRKP